MMSGCAINLAINAIRFRLATADVVVVFIAANVVAVLSLRKLSGIREFIKKRNQLAKTNEQNDQ